MNKDEKNNNKMKEVINIQENSLKNQMILLVFKWKKL